MFVLATDENSSDQFFAYKATSLIALNRGRWNKFQRKTLRQLLKSEPTKSLCFDEFDNVFFCEVKRGERWLSIYVEGKDLPIRPWRSILIDKKGKVSERDMELKNEN